MTVYIIWEGWCKGGGNTWRRVSGSYQQPTEPSTQPIRARHLGHVTGYRPIRDQYLLVRSVPGSDLTLCLVRTEFTAEDMAEIKFYQIILPPPDLRKPLTPSQPFLQEV